MARRPPPKPKSASLAPMLGGLGVLVVAAIAVLYIAGKTEPPPAEVAPATAKDPFAGVPDELPPSRAAGAATADPFARARGADAGREADPGAIVLGEEWTRALALGEEGLALVQDAAAAKAADDFDGFKSKGAEGKKKLEEALDLSRDLEQQLIDEHGESHPDVRAVQRTRSKWLRELVALKKTVGF